MGWVTSPVADLRFFSFLLRLFFSLFNLQDYSFHWIRYCRSYFFNIFFLYSYSCFLRLHAVTCYINTVPQDTGKLARSWVLWLFSSVALILSSFIVLSLASLIFSSDTSDTSVLMINLPLFHSILYFYLSISIWIFSIAFSPCFLACLCFLSHPYLYKVCNPRFNYLSLLFLAPILLINWLLLTGCSFLLLSVTCNFCWIIVYHFKFYSTL